MQLPQGPGETPERLPSYLLSATPGRASASPGLPSPALPPTGGGLFRSAGAPAAAVAFNERLRPGAPRSAGSLVSPGPRTPGGPPSGGTTPGRMPPSRSLMDTGPPGSAGALARTPTPRHSSTPRSGPAATSRWVTVFGFPAGMEAGVAREFRRHGEVVRTLAGRGNWLHVLYATPVQAQVALHRTWVLLPGAPVMVGTAPCTEPELCVAAEADAGRAAMAASPAASTRGLLGSPVGSLPPGSAPGSVRASPASAHRPLRTPSSILRRDHGPAGGAAGTPASIIRAPQPAKGFFGYIADLYG